MTRLFSHDPDFPVHAIFDEFASLASQEAAMVAMSPLVDMVVEKLSSTGFLGDAAAYHPS